MSKLLKISTGDIQTMRYIDFTIEFKNDNVIVCIPWASGFNIEDWLYFESVVIKGYPAICNYNHPIADSINSICNYNHPIADSINSTGKLQLLMAGVEIAQKLQMAFIDPKYLIYNANLYLNGIMNTGNNRSLFFPDVDKLQISDDSASELLVNNRIGRVTIDDGLGCSISKIYVPYNTPCKYHSTVSKNTKKTWNRIAESKGYGR